MFRVLIGELVSKHLDIYVFTVHAFILSDRKLCVIHQEFTKVRETTHTDRNRFFFLYEEKNKFQEEFEDTKRVIRIRISKKYRQNNGQKKEYKRRNNDLQNIHIKLKTK